jgi:lysophospholipase L1-like esterase
MKRPAPNLLLCILSIALFSCASTQRIVFLGDSITQEGYQPGGYVDLIRENLHRGGHPDVEIVGAGISGNKVPDLQGRLEKDVLSKKPTTVVIYIGINDVWHSLLGIGGTPKDRYEAGLRDLISRIHDGGAKVLLCTPSVVGEKTDGTNPLDSMLDEYSEISRKVAEANNIALCDLRRAFSQELKEKNRGNQEKGVLTRDGVHLNDAGNRFVAAQIERALQGFDKSGH